MRYVQVWAPFIFGPHVSKYGDLFSLLLTRSPWEFREFGNSGNCRAKRLCSKAKSLPRAWELLGSPIFSLVLTRSPREFREFGNSGNSRAKRLCSKAKSLPRTWELLGSHIYTRQSCVPACTNAIDGTHTPSLWCITTVWVHRSTVWVTSPPKPTVKLLSGPMFIRGPPFLYYLQ